MSLNSIMKIFQPKDRIFYTFFEEVVNTVAEMSTLLKKLITETEKDKRFAILSQIENAEHKNDDTTHRIFTELGRTFITPFDREDIHYLATTLDDVADYIYSSAKRIAFYNINVYDDGIVKLANLIGFAVDEIKIAVTGLRDMKNLQAMTNALVKINSIENQADDIYDLCVERLFEMEPDVKMLIKKREVYHAMETATDKCEDAGNAIESIIVKYA
jgi:predicted phosphate transport protein (TIGR00153 family)